MCPDEQKNAIFKDLNPHKHTQIMKTIVILASMGQVNNKTRGQGPYGYIGHMQGALGGPQNCQKIT